MFSKMKSRLMLIVILLVFAFVLEYGVTHNYGDFEYIYVNVQAAAGEDGIGEDDIGNYTDYWT